MSDFKPPMTWMKQVFTKTQFKKIEKDVDKLINDNGESKTADNHRQEVLRDKIIVQMSDSKLELPFRFTIQGGVIKHLKKINKNLFIAYPFYFDEKQFVMLAKSANDAGFKISVDPYASRMVGACLRVVIWKPNPKYAN